jgi:hypothetical protein
MQRLSSDSCAHRTPAGFPPGIPGIDEESDGAIQHAPQPARQSMFMCFSQMKIEAG